jgi:tether containing UBX domain for GLUT4
MEESRMDPSHASDLIASVARDLGREVRVFVSPAALDSEDTSTVGKPRAAQEEEPEDFYDFTAEDYARIMASRREEIYLKTRKIREQEQAARRAHMTKAIMRVQFPDNFVLEATFRSADSLSSLIELLQRALVRPDLPFYLYTVPPKKRIKDLQQSMIDAGFSPGALIYFAYETSKGAEDFGSGPYLRPEIQVLRDLHLLAPSSSTGKSVQEERKEREQAPDDTSDVPKRPLKPTGKPKPKWLKM